MTRLQKERALVLASLGTFIWVFVLWFLFQLMQPGAMERLELVVRCWCSDDERREKIREAQQEAKNQP